MKILLMMAVMLAGVGTAIQTGMNTQLRGILGHGLHSAVINFFVGLVAVVLITILMRPHIPSATQVASVPMWAWWGGFLGAYFVITVASTGSELGGLLLVALVVSGQLIASAILDHFGWLGFPVRPFSLQRAIACCMLLLGALLCARE